MRLKFGCCYLVAAMIVVLAGEAIPARADIIIGNLSSNDNNFSYVGEGMSAAMGFTVGEFFILADFCRSRPHASSTLRATRHPFCSCGAMSTMLPAQH